MADFGMLFGIFFLLGVILYFANLAEKQRLAERPYTGLAVTSYLLLIAFYSLAVVGGLVLQAGLTMLTTQPQLLEQMGIGLAVEDNPFLRPESANLLSVGIWLPPLVGMLLLLPTVRRLAARLIPIDPASPVHAIALAYVALVAMNLLVTLGIGLGNLSTMLETQRNEQIAANGADTTLPVLWSQQILMALLGLVGVGWLSRRNWSETLQRLGLVRPTLLQVIVGVVLALLLVPGVLLVEYLGSMVNLGTDPDVERLTEQMLGSLFHSLFGVFTVGAAAALGEETLLRGALQPRFGLLFTAFIFALSHSNYGITLTTLVVFLLGLLLGWVRIRYNTVMAMVIHATYNSTLALLAYLNVSF